MQRPQKNTIENIEEPIIEIIETNKNIKITGVCGICGSEYNCYVKAKKCCNNLKGNDYEQKINKVFQL